MIRLLSRQQEEGLRARIRSIDVVRAYGAILEDQPLGAGGSISDSVLPYDKALVKAALVDVATVDGVEHTQVGQLQQSFIMLGIFQRGGGGPSALDDGASLTRESITAFFQKWESGQKSNLNARVQREMKLLEGEWDIRIKMSKAIKNA